MVSMNVNTVRTPIDFGFDIPDCAGGREILDALYEAGIMVVMTVDDGINDLNRVESAVNAYKARIPQMDDQFDDLLC